MWEWWKAFLHHKLELPADSPTNTRLGPSDGYGGSWPLMFKYSHIYILLYIVGWCLDDESYTIMTIPLAIFPFMIQLTTIRSKHSSLVCVCDVSDSFLYWKEWQAYVWLIFDDIYMDTETLQLSADTTCNLYSRGDDVTLHHDGLLRRNTNSHQLMAPNGDNALSGHLYWSPNVFY